MVNIKLSFLELYETNNWFHQYIGALNELAERDIDFDYHYYICELKDITEKLGIDNMFNWNEIFELYENGDNEYRDMLLNIEDRIAEILTSAIYGVEPNE